MQPRLRRGASGEEAVRAHFRDTAGYWRDLYQRDDVVGAVFQDRQRRALRLVDQLRLTQGSSALEVGCGAGYLTLDLAARRMRLVAIDTAPEMLEIASGLLKRQDLAARVRFQQADVHQMPFPDGSFDLAVALGVIPWLHSPAAALRELARVLRPGGHLIVTSDNRARLNHLLDPRFSPSLAWLRACAEEVRRLLADPASDAAFHPRLIWPWRFEEMLRGAGLEIVYGETVGFGPFSFMAHPLLPGPAGVRLYRRLQALADRGMPILSALGAHQVVHARKPPSIPG